MVKHDQISSSDALSIKNLLAMEEFLCLQDSWRIARFIDNNWEKFGAAETSDLRDALIQAFDKYADWMGAFVTAEILGRRYADRAALEELGRLASSARLPARALVPHGLETMAKEGSNTDVRAVAVEVLRALSNSDVEQVRAEARESLSR